MKMQIINASECDSSTTAFDTVRIGAEPMLATNHYKKEGLVIKHIGEKYGSYTIVEKTNQKTNDRHYIYKAICDCGIERFATLSNIKYSGANGCPHYGWYGDIKIPRNSFKDNRIAHAFYGMLRRCYDCLDDDYELYGGKGVTVCQEWIDNPSLFESWSLSNGYKNKLTIDRINENDNYSPENCRWVSRETNSRFKSNTNYITATVTLSGRQWADLIPDVGENYINKMLKRKGEEETIKYIEHKLKDKRTS